MQSNLTLVLALWGSVLATLTFVWNLTKWLRDRPRLALTIEHREGPSGDCILMKIRNRGEKPTTVEEIMLVEYHNWFLRLLRFLPARVTYTSAKYRKTVKLPAKIGYGEMWQGDIILEADASARLDYDHKNMIGLLRDGRLVYAVRCAHSDRLMRGLVKKETWDPFN